MSFNTGNVNILKSIDINVENNNKRKNWKKGNQIVYYFKTSFSISII